MASTLTRAEFDRSRAAAAEAARRSGRGLAAFSVLFGIAQVMFLRWADVHMARGSKLTIAFPAFLAYMLIVGLLIRRMQRRQRQACPVCPQCGARLQGLSERVVAATGRCDRCGGVVIEDESPRDSATT